ncbi:MAG: cache domain-containing protein [Desulfonatronovibrio sp.]
MKVFNYKKTFQCLMLAIILISGTFVGFFWINREYQHHMQTMERVHADYVELRKTEVKTIIDLLVQEITHHQSEVEDRLKKSIKEKVRMAVNTARSIYESEKHRRDDSEIKQMIIDALMPLRFFDGRGYYWIHDTDHFLVAHPFRPASIGQDDSQLKDTKGKLLIQNFVSAALSNPDGGFVSYYWNKPGVDESYHQELGQKKIAYLQLFEPYNWVIGVGEYVDDVEAQTQAAMIRRIASVRYGEAGYIFNHSRDGICLNHINEAVIGRDRWDLQDAQGMMLVQELDRVGKQPGGGFLEYVATIDPRTGEPARKLSFIRSVEGWDWVLGGGVYIKDIELRLEELRTEMGRRTRMNILIAIAALGMTAALVMFVTNRLTAWFTRELNAFVPPGDSGEIEPVDIDQFRIAELREMAKKSNAIIAQKARVQAQLLQAQKMESVGMLAGGVAHDFNNLLQTISGNIELLLQKSADPKIKARLQVVARSMDRAAKMVKQLLLFSRKAESHRVPVDLNSELEQAAMILRRSIPKMIALDLQLDPAVRPVFADPMQVEQILLNLAGNAVDAMPEGGRLLVETTNVDLDEDFVRMHPGSCAGPHVLLTVTDTGHGIDRKVLDHVFDPFFTTKDTGRGTGLGLASVYGIVKAHDGYIQCYSEPGQGTIFKIFLPASAQDAVVEEGVSKEISLQGGKETILVVDDEEDIRELTREVLEELGYTVQTASSGEEALNIYQKQGQEIDLIMLDLNMPGMGGYKCLQELLHFDSGVKVIIASGYSAQGHAGKSSTSGARGFISKPYSLRELASKVRETLDAPVRVARRQGNV